MYQNPQFIKKMNANVEGRDFIVGDLHGCFDELQNLLDYVGFNTETDRLFSTGDLIDRGPKSVDCLSLLNKKWFFPVLGNHEDLFLDRVKELENNYAKLNKEEIKEMKAMSAYTPFILKMPLIYEVEHLLLEKFYIVHAEILPEHLYSFTENQIGEKEYEEKMKEMKSKDYLEEYETFFKKNEDKILNFELKQKLLWSRKIISSFYKEHKKAIDCGDFSFLSKNDFLQKTKIFCGHNVVPFPMKIGQQYYIDTGAALGYSQRGNNSFLFSQFGHEFFTLSMVDLTTGICYGCISSPSDGKQFEILKLEKPLYSQ